MRHPAPTPDAAKAARRPAPPRRPRVPAPDEKAAALRMFAQGATAPQAAKALGVSRATAYRWWGEHRGERAAQADPSQPAAEPVAEGTRPSAAQPPPDLEQEWATRLALAAARR